MKYKTILNSLLIIYILLSGSIVLFAQRVDTLNPKKYQYGNRHIIFEDNFDDDRNGWILNYESTKTEKAKCYNGKLYMENKDTSSSGCKIVLPINQEKDFDIEIVAQIIQTTNKKEKALLIAWGMDTAANTKDIIQIAQNGDFNISHCLGNDHKKCIQDYGYAHFNFKKDNYNVITIRKVAKKYYIFINHRLEEKADFYLSDGNTIMLGVGGNAIVAYDYINISYLDKKAFTATK